MLLSTLPSSGSVMLVGGVTPLLGLFAEFAVFAVSIQHNIVRWKSVRPVDWPRLATDWRPPLQESYCELHHWSPPSLPPSIQYNTLHGNTIQYNIFMVQHRYMYISIICNRYTKVDMSLDKPRSKLVQVFVFMVRKMTKLYNIDGQTWYFDSIINITNNYSGTLLRNICS